MGATAFLTQEIDRADPAEVPFAEYLVDTVIRLTYEEAHGRQRYRFIEVLKSRGQAHLGGKSAFRFAEDGVRVYPRLNPATLVRRRALRWGCTLIRTVEISQLTR